MKILHFTLRAAAAVCFAFIMSSASCDLLDKADEITFEAKLPLAFVVDEKAVNTGSKSYTYAKTLDALQNAEVAKYKDKIKKITINKITYVVSGYSAPGGAVVTFTNGKLTVASSSKTIAEAASVNLTSTAEATLTADIAGFNELADLIKADKSETVNLVGTFSSTPVAFTVTAYFHTTITAGVL